MPLKFALFLLLCAIICACSNNSNPTYPFERSVSDISIVKNPDDMAYIIKWRSPIEKPDLQSYYIWIDTTVVKDTAQNASQAQIDAASVVVPYNGSDTNSLVLTELIRDFMDRDSLHIAMWAKYGGSSQGVIQHLYIFFGDDYAPSIVSFSDSSSANTIWINWVRPTDQRDFYRPDDLSGPIAGYDITLRSSNENISYASLKVRLDGKEMDANVMRFHRFRKEGRMVVLEDPKISDSKTLIAAVIDGEGFNTENPQANNWSLQISGLKSETSYNVSITAWDSAGNSSKVPASRLILTTDSIAPLIANKFWFYADSDRLPRLDSNRLVLFWPKSVDPLTNPTQIELDSTLRFPAGCAFCSYREVQKYSVEQWNGTSWENVPRLDSLGSDYYNDRYRLENDSMIRDTLGLGDYVGDTLRWVAPGDTIILRIRAIDNSKHYSAAWIDTIAVSKGELWETQCPAGYMPVKNDSSVFCMEKLQHTKKDSVNKFENNVLYMEAKKSCESLNGTTGFENFNVSLCTELEWNAACTSRGSAYGVIEEKNAANSENNFSPSTFLFKYCGVGTGKSGPANNANERNKLCISPDGIRDLPGQLQEWVTANSDSGDFPLLKGTSYAIFQGASGAELAQCRNRSTPTRIRPKYTTDTVYLYKTGSRIDTLLAPDPDTSRSRYFYGTFPRESDPVFKDTILLYTLKSKDGDYLGEDYVNQVEYRRRGGEEWLKVLWQGLKYEQNGSPLPVLIFRADSIINASNFYLDPTAGFRCCANAKN